MPLPCSPASMSTGDDTSTSNSQSATDLDSEDSLTTPRPGPSAPEQRTHANLSRPVQPSADAFRRPSTFKDWSTDNIRERGRGDSGDEAAGKAVKDEAEPEDIAELERRDSQSEPSPPPRVARAGAASVTTSAASPTHGKKDDKDETQTEGSPPDFVASTASSTSPNSPKSTRTVQKEAIKLKDTKRTTSAGPSSNSPGAALHTIRSRPEPERSRSVSFHPSSNARSSALDANAASLGASPKSIQPSPFSAYLMARRASPNVSPHASALRLAEENESSADENTAIFRRSGSAKTGVGTANYGTTAGFDVGPDYEGAAEEDGDGDRGPVRASARDEAQAPAPRRRKSDMSKAGGAGTKSSTAAAGDTGEGRATPADGVDDEQDKEGWWKVFVEKYGSVELENKGSVARDHLALERTFLAWLRTSLSFASIGIAVTQLFRLNTTLNNDDPKAPSQSSSQHHLRQVGKPLGATFLGISILILFLGFHRYFESQHYVIRGKFPASRGSIILVSVVAGMLIVASLVVIVSVAPGSFEKR